MPVLRGEYAAYGKLRRVHKPGSAKYSLSCSFFNLGKKLTLIKKHRHTWLNIYSAGIVRHTLEPIETAYANFFKGKGGLPQLKSKWKTAPSFPIQFGMAAKLDGDWLHIQKIGYVKLIGSNPYNDGFPKSGTVKEENGDWFAYIVYETEINSSPHCARSVGLDRNTGNIALSDGQMFIPPDVSKRSGAGRSIRE